MRRIEAALHTLGIAMETRFTDVSDILARIENLKALQLASQAKVTSEIGQLKVFVETYLPDASDAEQVSFINGVLDHTLTLEAATLILAKEEYSIYEHIEDYAEEYLDNCHPIEDFIRYHIDLEALAETLLDGQPWFYTRSHKLVVLYL